MGIPGCHRVDETLIAEVKEVLISLKSMVSFCSDLGKGERGREEGREGEREGGRKREKKRWRERGREGGGREGKKCVCICFC